MRGNIRVVLKFLAAAALALTVGLAPAAGNGSGDNPAPSEPRSVESVLAELRADVRTTQRLNTEQVYELMAYGAQEGHMIFEVLNEMTMHLKANRARAEIRGSDLRAAESTFRLGDEQIDVLLPIAKIERVELGSTFGSNQSPFEVYLSEEHTDFLDVAYFDMEEHFGFATVEDNLFADGFGVRARRAFLRFRMSHMELEGDRRVRAHVHRFPRSRGMRFGAIERL